ncbi:hypothetical protein [Vibrio alfacsensis]|uniref:hypothetical protein n=1 Tax=Vibrio alfacsensis TaxID=1074311 RepID=UPI00406902CF
MIEHKHTFHTFKQLLQIIGHTVNETDSQCVLEVICSSKKIIRVICIDGCAYYKDISDECSVCNKTNMSYYLLNESYKKVPFFIILHKYKPVIIKHIVKLTIAKLIDRYKNVYPINDDKIECLVSPMLKRRLENCMTTTIPENSFFDELISDAFELVNQKYEQDLS